MEAPPATGRARRGRFMLPHASPLLIGGKQPLDIQASLDHMDKKRETRTLSGEKVYGMPLAPAVGEEMTLSPRSPAEEALVRRRPSPCPSVTLPHGRPSFPPPFRPVPSSLPFPCGRRPWAVLPGFPGKRTGEVRRHADGALPKGGGGGRPSCALGSGRVRFVPRQIPEEAFPDPGGRLRPLPPGSGA